MFAMNPGSLNAAKYTQASGIGNAAGVNSNSGGTPNPYMSQEKKKKKKNFQEEYSSEEGFPAPVLRYPFDPSNIVSIQPYTLIKS